MDLRQAAICNPCIRSAAVQLYHFPYAVQSRSFMIEYWTFQKHGSRCFGSLLTLVWNRTSRILAEHRVTRSHPFPLTSYTAEIVFYYFFFLSQLYRPKGNFQDGPIKGTPAYNYFAGPLQESLRSEGSQLPRFLPSASTLFMTKSCHLITSFWSKTR